MTGFAGMARCLENLLIGTARQLGEKDVGKLQQWRVYYRNQARPILNEYVASDFSPTYLWATKLLEAANDVNKRMHEIYGRKP